MDMQCHRGKADVEHMCEMLLKMKELNYQDLTFTGGEPLVAKRDLIRYLNFMEEHNYIPDLTIVTNGYLIDDELIARLKQYPGNFKFNFSMHSVDAETYATITQPKNNDQQAFERVVANMQKIKASGLPLKLNFVLLNGINTDPAYLERILAFAKENGAYAVKFLELLVTSKLNKFFNYYYSLDAAIQSLGEAIQLQQITYRRSEYVYKDELLVEFQKCTCANGCDVCPLNRELNVTPQLKYYPCFLLSQKAIAINSEKFERAIEEGDELIESLIVKYGNKSPIIIKNVPNQREKVEYFYEVVGSAQEIREHLESQGYYLERQRAFEDTFYFHEHHSEWQNFEKVVKLSKNTFDYHYREIVQQRIVDTETGEHKIQFLTDGKSVKDKVEYDQYMQHLGFTEGCTMKWEIKFYHNGTNTISISENKETKQSYIASERILGNELKKLQLKSIKQDIYQHIMNDNF